MLHRALNHASQAELLNNDAFVGAGMTLLKERYAVVGCVAIRLTMSLLFPSLQVQLDKSVELSTPMSSYRSLNEGVFLLRNGFPLYHGGVVHHVPLLVAFMSLIDSQFLIALLYAMTDGIISFQLISIAKSFPDLGIPAWFPGALYALNPLVILSCVSQSSVIFVNAFTSIAIVSALKGDLLIVALGLGTASYLSIYQLPLFVPLLFLLSRDTNERLKATLALIGVFVSLLQLSFMVTGASWEFLQATYWCQMNFERLLPNLGLWWYFFIEMFDMFIPFFKAAFNLFTISFIIPLSVRFQGQPFYAVVLCMGWLTLTKPYPTLGDTGFFLSFLPFFKPLFGYMRCPLLSALLFLHAIILSPIFYHIWVGLGTGNSNFFYAISLIYALAVGFILIDLCWSMLRIEFDNGKPNYNLKVTQI